MVNKDHSNKLVFKNKRIEIIKKLLNAIKQEEGDSFQFFLSYADKNAEQNDFNCVHSNEDDRFLRLNSMYLNGVITQQIVQESYRKMAENNFGHIIVCINDSNLPKFLPPIKKGLFYNAVKIIVREGETYYELEGQTQKYSQYDFDSSLYSSDRFVKLNTFFVCN